MARPLFRSLPDSNGTPPASHWPRRPMPVAGAANPSCPEPASRCPWIYDRPDDATGADEKYRPAVHLRYGRSQNLNGGRRLITPHGGRRERLGSRPRQSSVPSRAGHARHPGGACRGRLFPTSAPRVMGVPTYSGSPAGRATVGRVSRALPWLVAFAMIGGCWSVASGQRRPRLPSDAYTNLRSLALEMSRLNS